MRLLVDGHPTPTRITLDGERWKTSVGETSAAWFTSLKEARTSAERHTRSRIPLATIAHF